MRTRVILGYRMVGTERCKVIGLGRGQSMIMILIASLASTVSHRSDSGRLVCSTNFSDIVHINLNYLKVGKF